MKPWELKMLKMEPSGSHRASRCVQGEPQRTRLDPREAPMSSRGAQDGSREVQEGAKGAQREPRGSPRDQKRTQVDAQRRPTRHRLDFEIGKKP